MAMARVMLACVGCLLCAQVVAAPNELSRIQAKPHVINFGAAELTFSTPEGTRVIPIDPNQYYYEKDVNIHDEKNYENSAKSHIVFSQLWEIKGKLWQGTVGVLLVQISVRALQAGWTMDTLFSPRKDYDWFYVGETGWLTAAKAELPRVLNGRDDVIEYYAPLTKEHFVAISFAFIDESNRRSRGWQQQAADYMNYIVSTLKLERKSDHFPGERPR